MPIAKVGGRSGAWRNEDLDRGLIGMGDRSESGEASVGGTLFAGRGRPARTFPSGRVCSEQGCTTALSIYNDGEHCYLHETEKAPRLRGRKIA